MAIISLSDLDLQGQRVLIRQDLNVPIKNGVIVSDERIRASLITINMAIKKGAKVMLLSHLGRPIEGEPAAEFSLQPIATRLAELLKTKVRLQKNWLDGVEVAKGEIVLCENVRFNKGEKANDDNLSKKIAALCDVFVMDAFGTAHRIHASTYGIIKHVKIACCGLLLLGELAALNKVLKNYKKPLVAIVGGSKISTKLVALKALSKIVDELIVGGGIANTFIAAQGHNIGKSICEYNLIDTAKQLMKDCNILIPTDVVCANKLNDSAVVKIKTIDAITDSESIFDVGPKSMEQLEKIISNAGTIIWNGPVGVFEFTQFGKGTKAIAMAIAKADAFSIAGGGDTLAAIDKYAIKDSINYISTGGGAFLKFLEHNTLPVIDILDKK